MNGRSLFAIQNVRREDGGMYTCIAQNPAGEAQTFAMVIVKGKTGANMFCESIEFIMKTGPCDTLQTRYNALVGVHKSHARYKLVALCKSTESDQAGRSL